MTEGDKKERDGGQATQTDVPDTCAPSSHPLGDPSAKEPELPQFPFHILPLELALSRGSWSPSTTALFPRALPRV